MACGKPVIGTKVGGVPEALSNHDVGILVNPRDPELSRCNFECIREKMGTRNHNRVCKAVFMEQSC